MSFSMKVMLLGDAPNAAASDMATKENDLRANKSGKHSVTVLNPVNSYFIKKRIKNHNRNFRNRFEIADSV